MANTDNLTVAAKGFIYFANLGTTAPTDFSMSWPAGWEDAGIVMEEGLTEAVSEEETTFNGWGYNAPIRIEPKSRTVTFKATLAELTARSLSLYYSVPTADMDVVGSGPSVGVGFEDPETAASLYVALGMDIIDLATGRQIRYVVPRAKVSDRDNMESKADSMHTFGLTFTAMQPVSGGSAIHRFYSHVAL